jgi:AraC-like DNA-binding protein
MSPAVQPRRTTRALYAGHGVVLARVEHERRLLRGIKDDYAFVVPRAGAWEFLYRGNTYRQHPGVLQLKQPGELVRDLRRDGPATYDVVMFERAVLETACKARRSATELTFAVPQLAERDARASALLALHGLAERAGRAAYADPLALESAVAAAALVLAALDAPQREPRNERRAIQRAKTFLRERLDARVRLDELADHVRLDKYHLIRSFRAQVGVPPYEYLTHLRLYRARELLRAGEAAGAVATMVGFYDQSQLHRHFVKLVGMTPGQYARRARATRLSIALGDARRR